MPRVWAYITTSVLDAVELTSRCFRMLVDIERMAREHGDRLLAIEDRLRMSHIGQER